MCVIVSLLLKGADERKMRRTIRPDKAGYKIISKAPGKQFLLASREKERERKYH